MSKSQIAESILKWVCEQKNILSRVPSENLTLETRILLEKQGGMEVKKCMR